MTGPSRLSDERGSSLVELLVGMAMGMVVLAGLSMVIITTLHGNARVTGRVEATQNARIAVTKIIEQLHSACLSPRIIPIKENSSATELVFVHATPQEAGAVAPAEIESKVFFSSKALWETENGATRKLIANVGPGGPKGEIFSYFKFENGTVGEVPLPVPLNKAVGETVYVKVALNAEPSSNSTHDARANATVWDSATLRLTPPLYNSESVPPCQ
jgi:hypothetical protein